MKRRPTTSDASLPTPSQHNRRRETSLLHALMASPLSPEAEVLIPALARHVDRTSRPSSMPLSPW
ncbi:hypothetical protein PDG61_14875 [Mycolicibacterium sp. BiH015]|uniref:hypothetical protein n=1 Tax=Mycolicibacterium sp. BiH015 TaxID=3018808 RepID=UPI0022DFDCFA|nr:hypothetical protein [Mycolicibacterium sp. BiH015]MDA2892205.1 hypothetical protein [Mycolicibacterium sp. BiH015]